ncbi:MAG: hypothetical protein IKM60_04945 [Clostridia bacterium]|nr:hypothetical protein [Clostridia bacterium]
MRKSKVVLWISIFILLLTFVAFQSTAMAAGEPSTTTIDGKTYYQLGTKEDLLWFRDQVNSGNTGINAILTANITVNTNVLDASGNLKNNGAGLTIWKPIGYGTSYADTPIYTGTFDGNGKTISGLYYHDPAEDTAYYCLGLFGRIGESATVKNVTIADSYLHGYWRVGAIAGISDGTIQGCTNTSTINAANRIGGIVGDCSGTVSSCVNKGKITGRFAGGVVGTAYGTLIDHCYNTGTINCYGDAAGIVNDARSNTSVQYCYNTDAVSSETGKVGGIAGYFENSSMRQCYNTGIISYSDEGYAGLIFGQFTSSTMDDLAYADQGFLRITGRLSSSETDSNEQGRFTPAETAAGKMTYWLNSRKGSNIWYQDIGTDASPSLDASKGIVYRYKSNCTDYGYANTPKSDIATHKDLRYSTGTEIDYGYIIERCHGCWESCSVRLSAPDNLVYDGTEKSAVITYKGTPMAAPGTEYISNYQGDRINVTDAGFTATLHYAGYSTSFTFKIAPKPLKQEDISLEYTYIAYDGTEHTPTVAVISDGVSLTAGKDYTVTYQNNAQVGTAKVIVTGKGNYTGTQSVSFQIMDMTAPEGIISIEGNYWDYFNSTVDYGLFIKDSAAIKVITQDTGSGVAKVEYYLAEQPLSTAELSTVSFTEMPDTGLVLTAPQKGFFYVRIIDHADNSTLLNADGVVVYADSMALTEEISYIYKENADKEIIASFRGNLITGIAQGANVLVPGVDFSVVDERICLHKAYLDTLPYSEDPYLFTVSYAPVGVETEQVTIETTFGVKVEKAPLTLESVTLADKVYDGTKDVAVLTATLAGVRDADNVGVRISDLTAFLENSKAGTHDKVYIGNISLYSDDAENYQIDPTAVLSMGVTVQKAAAPVLEDKAFSANYRKKAFTAKDLGAAMPEDAGKLAYRVLAVSVNGKATANAAVKEDGTLSLALAKGAVGDQITVTVSISSENYEDATLTTTLTLIKGNTPDTSDNANLSLYLTLLLAAGSMLAMVLRKKARSK